MSTSSASSSEPQATTPVGFLRLYAARPGKAYCATCTTYSAFLVVLIVLIASLGDSFFPFTTDVPLYLRGNKYKIRDDALEAGELIAATELTSSVQLPRSQSEAAEVR